MQGDAASKAKRAWLEIGEGIAAGVEGVTTCCDRHMRTTRSGTGGASRRRRRRQRRRGSGNKRRQQARAGATATGRTGDIGCGGGRRRRRPRVGGDTPQGQRLFSRLPPQQAAQGPGQGQRRQARGARRVRQRARRVQARIQRRTTLVPRRRVEYPAHVAHEVATLEGAARGLGALPAPERSGTARRITLPATTTLGTRRAELERLEAAVARVRLCLSAAAGIGPAKNGGCAAE